MNYFFFRPSVKSMNFLILKNSNNILLQYIILFTTYIITISTYTIIIMRTSFSTNIISTIFFLFLSLTLSLIYWNSCWIQSSYSLGMKGVFGFKFHLHLHCLDALLQSYGNLLFCIIEYFEHVYLTWSYDGLLIVQ